MCLISFIWQPDQITPLVLTANRDEFKQRPTKTMHWWDQPHMLAGKDLQAGGTWLAVNRQGYWGALTNVRDPQSAHPSPPQSRGDILIDFMGFDGSIRDFCLSLQAKADNFDGFNLIIGNQQEGFYFTNRRISNPGSAIHWCELEPGIHSLSNANLNTPWPKTETATANLQTWWHTHQHQQLTNTNVLDGLAEVLRRTALFADETLPNTGVPLEWEQRLSPLFIQGDDYGTRSQTQLIIHDNQIIARELANVSHDGHNNFSMSDHTFEVFEILNPI